MRLIFIVFISICLANKTLVILERNEDQQKFSQFIELLKKNGDEVEIINKMTLFQLFENGEKKYSNVILLTPHYTFKKVSVKEFIQFIDNGGNMVITVGKKYEDGYKQLLYSLDMEVDSNGSNVVDEKHTVKIGEFEMIFSNNVHNNQNIFNQRIQNILFSGIGLYLPPSPFTSSLLKAQNSASTSLFPNVSFAQETNITLVASLQARNNARIIVSGSSLLFSNIAFDSVIEHPSLNLIKSDNKKFTENIIDWVLQRRCVIRMKNIHWEKINGVKEVDYDHQLVINDTIKVNVELEQLDQGNYVPFNVDDLQIEFKLLDPVIVKNFKRIDNGKYEVIVQTPDKFGVYTMIINYRRPFLSYLEYKETIPLRTFRLTQVDRFLTGAYPFYAACASMAVGFIVFSFIYLNQIEKKEIKQD
ncbi:dolichyl-diphosphooligosaccharide-protein glycotransferase, putative [Entamoeba histolytica HM-1:IMSS-B]|uniref:Dolichyl-diphosphooligosaccharide--protein glycosyltransferase 48 kDa subunit n=4 Tax=Entamoeba histolytica TaxID=5759 RepID=C4LWN1_ENTH1|nr:dolichyl-di-phosphooligosaccharide-protein glycotransferase, putative [Entamoeba histolytica HM-1:IMSS]EAL43566.1 dolichyl-di-phosphooligosaccharide-protein glycotransferase, putative [Entamoeba histolytica HM-1:IMSS]EMH72807.1 dolichyl-diphosphooligosaccharide-protein glycotransferase, putative [Entamoeba histolytica HM-1:IMSS-B]ENY64400.1 dolichyl-diphosphooligosaccharide--protein glycosyltransferase 48 kDa subunit precursor, putative [Entamoeba histolytica HM-1:IMSS-A]GAT93120.1 dolichyl-|eukprot:XP_648945.1 dolichyl-di-phosphooligosaccharide-protein glycotransferase, putative [Entamoeba histolytica HM-1:IMSS]